MSRAVSVVALVLFLAASSQAAIIISEIHPSGSAAASNNLYTADFFELTNTGLAPVSIAGWRMDDDSNSPTSSVALRGVTSIAPGQSIVFLEGDATGSTDAALQTSFISSWFNGSAPAGFTMGFYGGSGVGLGQTSDAVNIFDGNLVTSNKIVGVTFGATTAKVTFDNAAGLSGAVSTLSQPGVNGAFVSPRGETGSPGLVPEPASASLMALGLTALAFSSRRRHPSRRGA
jgi:hypothetical protein